MTVSDRQLGLLFDSIAEAVISADGAGRVVRLNRAAEALTGWPRREAAGVALARLLQVEDGDGAPVDVLASVRRGGALGSGRAPLRLRARDGRLATVTGRGLPVRRRSGAITALHVVLRDVGEQQALEARLRHGERLASLGRVAAGLVHDLDNRLTVAMASARLLARALPARPELAAIADGIHESAHAAGGLAHQLLDLARRRAPRHEPFDMHAAARAAAAMLARTLGRRITVQLALGAEAAIGVGDRGQLENALLNLGLNARDALPDGGLITISTTDASAGAAGPGRHLELVVSDDGTGMTEEVRRRAFEPFFTTKRDGEGTGLGLAAVRDAVLAQGGLIEVDSAPGRGTRVRLLLPVVTADHDERAAPAPASRGRAPDYGV